MSPPDGRRTGSATLAASVVMAVSWGFALPLYDTPSVSIHFALQVVAFALLLAAAPRPDETGSPPRWHRAAAAGALAVGLLLAFPWSSAPYWAAAAWLLGGSRLGSACRRMACVVGVQAAALLVLRLATLDELVPTSVTGAFAWLAGQASHHAVQTSDVGLVARVHGGSIVVRPTLDSTGMVIVCLVLASLWALRPSRTRTVLGMSAVVVVFAALRYALLLAYCLESGEAAPLTDLPATAATFLPLAILAALLPLRRPDDSAPDSAPSRGFRPAAAAAGVLAALLTLSYGLADPGTPKAGRVLVDETHGSWEPGDVPMGLANFGTDSIYNYTALWRWLDKYYAVSRRTSGPLDPATLAGCDVLVLKTPSLPYTPAEIDAIEAFVSRGGGLLAIGDHTDVFGTTTCLNAVLARFDLQIRRDVGLIVHQRAIGDYRYRPDPTVGNVLTRFLRHGFDFMGSASVDPGPGGCDHFIAMDAQGLERADYRDGSFFGDRDVTVDDEIRPFISCASRYVGRGRVAVWGDSTIFSNFAMFEPGKPETFLALIDHLDRENGWVAGVKVLLRRMRWALVVLLAGLVFSAAPARLLTVLIAIAAGAGGGGAASRLQVARLGDVEPRTPVRWVGFDAVCGRPPLSVPAAGEDDVEQAQRTGKLEALYLGVLRAGDAYPCVVDSYDRLERLSTLVVMEPSQAISDADVARVYAAVERGMNLVVIESAANASAAVRPLLEPARLSFVGSMLHDTPVRGAQVGQRRLASAACDMLGFFDAGLLLTNWERDLVPGDKIDGADAVEVLSVRGGDALWTVGGNAIPVLARSRVGNGAVYAYAGASGFSERELGSSGDTLNAADTQLGSYRRLLALLDATGAVPAAKTPPDAAAQRSSGEPAVADTSAVESLFEGPRRGGTYRASVRVFVKSYSHVAFLAGYVLSDGRNGVLHVVGDDGSGALQPRSHGVELHAGGTALSWVQREHAAVVRIPRVVPDGGCFLRPSPRWRTLTWVVSESTQDPFAPYRDRESPLFDLGKELIAQDATAGRLPTSGWQDLPLTGPYREFRTRDESRLGGGCIGRAHIWVDATHGVPKMARFELRFAGRPGVGSWYDVVVLYGDVSWHPDRFVPDAVHAPHVFQPDGEQLRWLRGE